MWDSCWTAVCKLIKHLNDDQCIMNRHCRGSQGYNHPMPHFAALERPRNLHHELMLHCANGRNSHEQLEHDRKDRMHLLYPGGSRNARPLRTRKLNNVENRPMGGRYGLQPFSGTPSNRYASECQTFERHHGGRHQIRQWPGCNKYTGNAIFIFFKLAGKLHMILKFRDF